MADTKTTGGSLADRLTKADGSKFESPKAAPEIDTTEVTDSKSTGESTSWADDVETPTALEPEPVSTPAVGPKESSSPKSTRPEESSLQTVQPETSSLGKAQLDGATEYQAGSANFLDEPSYDVNIKLSDAQADPNNPLYSLKRFEDLGV